MAFVALTACTVTIKGVGSGRKVALHITKATAVGMVTFTRDTQTFAMVNEDFFITDAYTGDAVNVTDYLEVYIGGQTTSRRILGGIMKTAPTGADRLMEGPFSRGQLSLYWSSA